MLGNDQGPSLAQTRIEALNDYSDSRAARDRQDLASNETRTRAREECDGMGDVLRMPGTTCRDPWRSHR